MSQQIGGVVVNGQRTLQIGSAPAAAAEADDADACFFRAASTSYGVSPSIMTSSADRPDFFKRRVQDVRVRLRVLGVFRSRHDVY